MTKPKLSKGIFITFEGGEGSGKTSQINKLSADLVAQGYKVTTTREPGGTEEAEKIRELLVQRNGGDWLPMAEVLLLYAARLMHIEKVIKPALEEGSIVLCDRFSDSTLAYQGYGRKLDIAKIKEIEKASINNFSPDLTIILDVDAQTGLSRSTKRLAEQSGYEKTEDRFERLEIDFHERLRQGFLEIAKENTSRCAVIDTKEKSIDEIAQQVHDIVIKKLA